MEENWIKHLARSQIGKTLPPPVEYTEIVQNELIKFLVELYEEAIKGAEIYNRFKKHKHKMSVIELPKERNGYFSGFTLTAGRHNQTLYMTEEGIIIKRTILVGFQTKTQKLATIKGIYDGLYGVVLYMNERICSKEEVLRRLFISHHELSMSEQEL